LSGGALKSRVNREKFEGGHQQTLSLPVKLKSLANLLVVGWDIKGKELFEELAAFRKLGHTIYEEARRGRTGKVALAGDLFADLNDSALCALWEGVMLGAYRFERYKRSSSSGKFTGISELKIVSGLKVPAAKMKECDSFCRATLLARDLINLPAADCTPTTLRDLALSIARKGKLKCTVFDRSKLKKMGAGGLLGVAQGSEEPPYLLKLVYRPAREPKKVVALVGKGVTFDSGGLSIKPAGGMETMKCDMSGAAAVLSAMQAVAELKPEVEVRAYVPTTENMINGLAMRPGDVLRAMSGKTIEVLNTDAEGRLILADALHMAGQDKADVIIDLATLTGACVVAMGDTYAALFASDDGLARDLQAASVVAGERLWRMPLAPEYRELIKSSVADIKNTGGRSGGAITAALFLQEFVDTKKTHWAHLDIAGPAFLDSDRGHLRKGGTGFGVRTLLRYLMSL
jgi:leucyl aminopeptidase